MAQYTYYFEDFPQGEVVEFGQKLVTRDELIEFAQEYDPQPFHLDDEAAEKSLFRGLSCSGWHNCAMLMEMICTGYLNQTASLGFTGFEEVRWMKPVRPGYELSVKRTCLSAELDESDPPVGVLTFRFEVFNQDGLQVLLAIGTQKVLSRAAKEGNV